MISSSEDKFFKYSFISSFKKISLNLSIHSFLSKKHSLTLYVVVLVDASIFSWISFWNLCINNKIFILSFISFSRELAFSFINSFDCLILLISS